MNTVRTTARIEHSPLFAALRAFGTRNPLRRQRVIGGEGIGGRLETWTAFATGNLLNRAVGAVLPGKAMTQRATPLGNKGLLFQRIKTVSADLRDRLVSAAIADLTNELTKLEHERQLLLQMGTSPDHDDMRALVGALETAREAIERMK